jgi:hypothetical protein
MIRIRARCEGPEPLERPVLQHPKQLRLQLEGARLLVEEERGAVGEPNCPI